MIKKILIANRGEIALHIIKTCQRLGIATVAVYSEADSDALFVKAADEAYCIGPAPSSESYLMVDKIIDVAKRTGTSAIHPGYGFLSESTQLVHLASKENIIFIGPKEKSIKLMGSKSEAKNIMEKAKVPIVPGYHGEKQDEVFLLAKAKKIGFPVLLKAAQGGGGKGMRIVETEEAFSLALKGAKREAQKSFGDDHMLIEKYLKNPRHIEIQIIADAHGNTCHLFERDCSIQRRHQKIVEEAPALSLPDKLKKEMYQAGINAAKAVDYVGAGTIEFLVEDDSFYFMEMNTRLQVEHPVTEAITGLDLVELQIDVANGKALPFKQDDIKATGHAIELRLYAEDPDNQFMPQTGVIEHCYFAEDANIRVDSGIQSGSEISMYYDPMIAKFIAYGKDREACMSHLRQGLKRTFITGIKHNLNFLNQIMATPAFMANKISTRFLNEETLAPLYDTEHIALFATLFDVLKQGNKSLSPWQYNQAFKLNLAKEENYQYSINDTLFDITIMHLGDNAFRLSLNDKNIDINATLNKQTLKIMLNDALVQVEVIDNENGMDILSCNGQFYIERYQASFANEGEKEAELTSPMPGNVVAVLCDKKQAIQRGQTLMVIEAMKMEHSIVSPKDAIVKEIFYRVGAKVNEGDRLLELESEEG